MSLTSDGSFMIENAAAQLSSVIYVLTLSGIEAIVI